MNFEALKVKDNTVEKVTFQYVVSHENWIENRNDDGVCESLTVRVHGWTSEYQPPSKTSYHAGTEGPDYSHDSLYQKQISTSWQLHHLRYCLSHYQYS